MCKISLSLYLHSETHEVTVHKTIRLAQDILSQGAPGAVEQLHVAEKKGALVTALGSI